MENNHKEALRIYHETLLKETKSIWTTDELLEIFDFKKYVSNHIDSCLLELIKTDSSAYDCLMCPLEDMPLFINDNEHYTKKISEYRLKHGK